MKGSGWTIGGLPELAHLTPRQRRHLLGLRVVGWYLQLIAYSILLGGLAAGLFGMALGVAGAPDQATRMLGGIVWCLAAVVVYRALLWQIRAAIRLEVKVPYTGRRLPFCFACGYDLTGASGDRCPECGQPVQVPTTWIAPPVDRDPPLR